MTWSATRVLCPRCAPTMNKLFEPTEVLEPSFVPLWIVQYSRMTLLSPISTPDEPFGLKLRSCGKDPIIFPNASTATDHGVALNLCARTDLNGTFNQRVRSNFHIGIKFRLWIDNGSGVNHRQSSCATRCFVIHKRQSRWRAIACLSFQSPSYPGRRLPPSSRPFLR